MEKGNKHFVLVHGICLGAWCWNKLATLLESTGHRVTALDLVDKDEVATTIFDCLQPLMDFMASLPQEDKVILVGHSYGGFAISLAMETFPDKILVAVYISAFMPNLKSPPATLVEEFFRRTPMDSLLDFKFSFDHGIEKPPTSAIFGPNYITNNLCQNCPIQDLESAKMRVRSSGLFLKDLGKESLLTEQKFGSVDRIFILCKDDKLLTEDFQRWFIENGVSTKDVKVIEVEGADHMVMLSKPRELCQCLLEITQLYD